MKTYGEIEKLIKESKLYYRDWGCTHWHNWILDCKPIRQEDGSVKKIKFAQKWLGNENNQCFIFFENKPEPILCLIPENKTVIPAQEVETTFIPFTLQEYKIKELAPELY